MKVCFIGEFSNRKDEGYRNVIQNISERIGEKAETITINTRPLRLGRIIGEVKAFQPDIVHYFSAPTLSSLMITKIAKRASRNKAKTIISSLHPNGYRMIRNPITKSLASLCKPDLILTQNNSYANLLHDLGYKTVEFPNGANIERFKPVSLEEKRALRTKYGLDTEKTIILHVGHILGCRGLSSFSKIMDTYPDIQALIIGSTYFNPDKSVLKELNESRCIVWRQYFEKIEELYQLSDIYGFPVDTNASLFLPLSVIEAMSCNLPIVTSNFESLEQVYGSCKGLYVVESMDEFVETVGRVMKDTSSETRDSVKMYSWTALSNKLINIYGQLLEVGQ